uniref:zinc finger protein 770-like n=1 Tax=Epinephelus lanceolatus TaxID=310571 RepID=UPI00144541BF|nr:zinc finger protein 770-like [Epinephelus lanceolatus]
MKLHQCHLCSKSFPSPSKLKRHYVIHTGQRPFLCTICGKAFSQSHHLKLHKQKVHPSRPPSGPQDLQDGILTRDQHPKCDNPAAGINTHGRSNYTPMPVPVSSSVASHMEQKREIVTDNIFLPSSENMPCVNNGSVTLDAVPQTQVDSANGDTSVRIASRGYICKVCLKSFSSSLQLWVHAPTHNKPKQRETGRESSKTFSEQGYSKGHLQTQKLSSGRGKITLKHQCHKCLKTFCTPSKLQRHFLIHTGQKPYSCKNCFKSFRQKEHLQCHLNSPNRCPLTAGTEKKQQRFCHSRQSSGLQPQSATQQRPTSHRPCTNSSMELELQCKISVNAVQDLNTTEIKSEAVVNQEQPLNTSGPCQSIHHKSDEQEQQHSTREHLKPFQCAICSRSFRLRVNLIRHRKIHRNQKELGGRTSVQNSNDRMSDSDAMKHSPEPIDLNIIVKPETWSPNGSDYSDSLPQDSELITAAEQQRQTCRATRERQRIKPLHQCHTCLKYFPSASKLQRHAMTHTGQRPFACETCEKRFRQKSHLRVHCRSHLRSRYPKQRSLYINRPPSRRGRFNTRTAADVSLQEMLADKKDFETHTGSYVVSVKHLDETSSVVIIESNREPDKLLPHTSKNNEVVRNFSNMTAKRKQIPKSTQNPGILRHQCSRCLKCFPCASKLQRHEMVHTGVKPFQCAGCGKAFRQAGHLKIHEGSTCKGKPPKPVNQQGNSRKEKAHCQPQLYPRISVRIPQKKKSANTHNTVSHSDCAEGNGVSAKANGLLKTKAKSNVACKEKKLHTCRICFKSFPAPTKLSRHMVTHSGVRPYKCSLCSKTFTQHSHLKTHEHKCRQSSKMFDCIQEQIQIPNHLQDTCSVNLIDFNVDATKEQPESHYTSVGHYSLSDGDLSYCAEARHTEWLAVPEVGSQEEQRKAEETQRDNCHQATDSYSYSFPSDLASEINKLVQNQNMAPLLQQYESNAHTVETTCPLAPKGVAAISDSNKLLGDELPSPVVENQMQPDDYWSEPIIVFECGNCITSFKSQSDLKQHVCSTHAQPEMTKPADKNRCDICFKRFVTPSKLKRHYVIHTGQRPFSCDICGKTFSQAAHIGKHRLTH